MKNKTKEVKADWEIEFEEKFVYSDGVIDEYAEEVLEWIKKNFVSKGEVREMIEDIQATEIADHSLASLIEKLYKYKKSLE